MTEVLRITVTPESSGTAWYVELYQGEGEWSLVLSGGSPGKPKKKGGRTYLTTEDWFHYAKDKLSGRTPGRVLWSQRELKPFGYSEGSWHAPNGCVIEVPMRPKRRAR